MNNRHIFEVLTPKQSTEDFEPLLIRFADKFRRILDANCVVSIPDNPMGVPRFRSVEVIRELGLPCPPNRVLLHLNTFHTRSDLDHMLAQALQLHLHDLLIVSGDGSERLTRLRPESLGVKAHVVTSVELLQFLHREYPGLFRCGVAFNPYEPPIEEMEKMRRKMGAGAVFAVTQPLTPPSPDMESLFQLGLPAILGAWMSPRLDLLSHCVGQELGAKMPFDPVAALQTLRRVYPQHRLYLSMAQPEKHLPLLLEPDLSDSPAFPAPDTLLASA